jgi:hypothetical protein
MSTTSVWISIASILAGFITQAVNTGSLFGMVTVPKAWLPYLSLIGTFVAGVVGSLMSTGAITSASLGPAILAGFMALAGTTVGVTVHQHLKAHLGKQTPPANDNAKKAEAPAAAAA